jgi:predicted RNase H-like HicB family nuclease
LASKRRRISKEVIVENVTYKVKLQSEDEGGYFAVVSGLPGCLTQGNTIKEVMENAKDAISCYLEAIDEIKKETF